MLRSFFGFKRLEKLIFSDLYDFTMPLFSLSDIYESFNDGLFMSFSQYLANKINEIIS